MPKKVVCFIFVNLLRIVNSLFSRLRFCQKIRRGFYLYFNIPLFMEGSLPLL
ncbi:hypothetical protein GIB67_041522 [Kingdonia uniflora]|uniref:Uncharacterized protein n=1 Tax=Kingdonia uniflora TaxID=39325 RepID=A0A7J7MQ99_9MAGN|nr:hypothetical protein GIB67_041522 [Kingdonia uniflora]